jgi:hypothetical protein
MSVRIFPITDGIIGKPATEKPFAEAFPNPDDFEASLVQMVPVVWSMFADSEVTVIGRRIPLRKNEAAESSLVIDLLAMDKNGRLYIIENQDVVEHRPVSKAYSKSAWVRHHYGVEDVVNMYASHANVTFFEALETLTSFAGGAAESGEFELSSMKPAIIVVATDVTPGEGVTAAALADDGNKIVIIKPGVTVISDTQMLVLQRCFPATDLAAESTMAVEGVVEPLVESVPVLEEPQVETQEDTDADRLAEVTLAIMEMVSVAIADNKLTKAALRKDVKGGKVVDAALADLEERELIEYSKEENTATGRNHTVVELTEAGVEWMNELRARRNQLPDAFISVGVSPHLQAWVPENVFVQE